MRHIGAAGILAAALGLMLASNADINMGGPIKFKPARPKAREQPVMNLPLKLRQENWLGRYRQGSCVHASWTSLLRWQGQFAWADYWKNKYGDGEYYAEMAQRLDAEGIKWAGTYQKFDVKFLEWAIRTRRGCMVTIMGGAHMVDLIDLDKNYAWILDNNDIKRYHKWPRNEFLTEWRNAGSWAMTPVYTPAPPLEKPQ